jgi:hypothetical protein
MPPFCSSVRCFPRPRVSPCSSPPTLLSTRATLATIVVVMPPVTPPREPLPAPHRSPPHEQPLPPPTPHRSRSPATAPLSTTRGVQPLPPSRRPRAHLHPDAGHLHHSTLPILRHAPFRSIVDGRPWSITSSTSLTPSSGDLRC